MCIIDAILITLTQGCKYRVGGFTPLLFTPSNLIWDQWVKWSFKGLAIGRLQFLDPFLPSTPVVHLGLLCDLLRSTQEIRDWGLSWGSWLNIYCLVKVPLSVYTVSNCTILLWQHVFDFKLILLAQKLNPQTRENANFGKFWPHLTNLKLDLHHCFTLSIKVYDRCYIRQS